MKKFFERFCYITRKNTVVNLEEDVKTLITINEKLSEEIKDKEDVIVSLIAQIDELKGELDKAKEEAKPKAKSVKTPKKDKKTEK